MTITDPIASAKLFKPELLLSAAMLLVVAIDATRARWRDGVNFAVTALSLAAAAWLCLPLRTTPAVELWSGMVALDPISVFFKILLIVSSLLVLVMFRRSRELAGLVMSEFYALLLAVTVSTLLLATANDLAMLYLALEMVSVTSYVMVAYMKGDKQSNEASLKYILFGAVSTGVMLYGLSLMYGLTSTTSIPAIRDALASGLLTDENRLALYVISLLVFAGFGFKTAAAPFHFWCPDVYQGAPTPVTAFLSVAPKAAGFAITWRFFSSGLATPGGAPWDLLPTIDWQPVLMVVSILTMTVGNVAALTQTNMKRLLAYSSIAHAGYILMGVIALSENGARSILVYLLAYVFMNLGAFLIVTLIHYYDGSFELRDYPGLYRRAPFLTLAMAVFLLSLMGIPPLVGFMGKFYVFSAIVQAAGASGDPAVATRMYVFAVIGAVNAAVAAFYYARVLKTMVIEEGNEEKPALAIPALDSAWVMLLVAANVLPLLFWNTIEGWARGALVLTAGR
jgi:NADH-quinone oxidoreductase subunit N